MDVTRRKIYDLTNYAVKSHKLGKKRKCEECGCEDRLEKHHPDYTKPLKVVFLCVPCHRKVDGKKRIGLKYRKFSPQRC